MGEIKRTIAREETLKLQPCPVCGGSVLAGDCGYSSCNPGWARCPACDLSWDLGYVQNEWHAGEQWNEHVLKVRRKMAVLELLKVDRKFTPSRDYRLEEMWEDTICLVVNAWDTSSTQTVVDGNGILSSYFASGNLSERVEYAYGVMSGAYNAFYPAGNLRVEGQYTGGLRSGAWKHWYSNGVLEKTSVYEKGQLHGEYEHFHKNGDLNVKGMFASGQKSGTWTWFTSTGEMDQRGEFLAGLPHGGWEYWYSKAVSPSPTSIPIQLRRIPRASRSRGARAATTYIGIRYKYPYRATIPYRTTTPSSTRTRSRT